MEKINPLFCEALVQYLLKITLLQDTTVGPSLSMPAES